MAISGFKKALTNNAEINRIQLNIAEFVSPLTSNPMLDGRLIENVVLGTTETLIEHKLGRAYQGWIIVNKNAAQDVYVSSTSLPKKHLALTAGGTVTVSIWVF